MDKIIQGTESQLLANGQREEESPAVHTAAFEKSIILVVTRKCYLSDAAMEYSLSVAQRLDHRLLIAYVNTMPFLWNGSCRENNYVASVQKSGTVVKQLGQLRGVTVNYIKESGRICRVVSRLCRILKKIEFVIVDKDINTEKLTSTSPVPIFNVFKI